MNSTNLISATGAIATALMALAALVTIIISLKQNRKNKELQINTFKYQQDMAWLNELRKAFVNFMACVNPNDMIVLRNMIKVGDVSGAKNFSVKLKNNFYTTKSQISALLEGRNYTPRQMLFVEKIDNAYNLYKVLIADFKWVINALGDDTLKTGQDMLVSINKNQVPVPDGIINPIRTYVTNPDNASVKPSVIMFQMMDELINSFTKEAEFANTECLWFLEDLQKGIDGTLRG